ncbi:MAG: hypothetical protein WBJ62_03870 [Coriobacteriia bacterium]
MGDLARREDAAISLPSLPDHMLPAIAALTDALGIPRDVLASDEEVSYAWQGLPREIQAIPGDLRGELIARMCVAVSTGLFDGAINYIWNATILHLRQRVRSFGLPVVTQILQRDFEERQLLDQQDSQLLDLCLKLNLITEDGYFFLGQCRDTRNNFSAAHPTIGKINDREFTAFLNRCVRYALSDDSSPKGVDISAFMTALKVSRFSSGQCEVWVGRLRATHEAQRELLLGMVHGVYCDPSSPEPARLNALELAEAVKPEFTEAIRSELITRHSDYLARGDTVRHSASKHFFEKLGLVGLLNEPERHALFAGAVQELWTVHQEMNNFYNEGPFAQRLRSLSENEAIPETIQEKYVEVVINCYVGNGYGVAWSAEPHYEAMIRSFSPRELTFMMGFAAPESDLGRVFK